MSDTRIPFHLLNPRSGTLVRDNFVVSLVQADLGRPSIYAHPLWIVAGVAGAAMALRGHFRR